MRRRLALLLFAAATLLALALWVRNRDDAALPGGWRPPKLAAARPSTPARAADPGVEWGVLVCTVDSAFAADPGRLVATRDGGQTAVSTAAGLDLTLTLGAGEWNVNWHAGHGGRSELRRLGTVDVESGEVQRCSVPKEGWSLTGNVVDGRGEPQAAVRVEGCGGDALTDERGVFTLAMLRGDCLVRAWAADGALQRPGEPVYFTPFDPPASPTFRLDTSPIGGVGLALAGASDGLRVNEVIPGGAGEAAGIEAGDLIVEVNGESTAGWAVNHGVETITGVPGSSVRLRVQHDDAETDHVLVRERIEVQGGTADTGAPQP